MTPRANRFVRGSFLAVFLLVGVAVVWTLKPKPAVEPAAAAGPSPAPTEEAAQAKDPPVRTGGYVHTRVKGEKTVFKIIADKVVGAEEAGEVRLSKVTVSFPYLAQGEPSTGTVVSDECVYSEKQEKAVFRGHVRLTTTDGFELTTDALIYKGDKGLARSDDPVAFKRQGMSGTSTGILYDSQKQKIELMADAVIDLVEADRTPTHIRSDRAVFAAEQGNPRFMSETESEDAAKPGDVLRFLGNVEVTQGTDRLKCDRFIAYMSGADHAIYRAIATEGVDLATQNAQLMPGTQVAGASNGPRRLRCRKLDLWYRPDHTLDKATAGPDAILTLLPGPKDPPERRELKAKILAFSFDAQGRLEELRGQREAGFVAEPIAPAKGAPRTLACDSFTATMDPATGEPAQIQFSTGVRFHQGSQEARSERAHYDGPSGILQLRENPQLLDTEQGSDLRAQTIDVATRSGDIGATKGVRHEIQEHGQKGGGGLLARKDAPALITSTRFRYDGKTKLAHYSEQAVLRSERDEVRGDEIEILEAGEGKRRLVATGAVASRLHPRSSAPGTERAPIETRSREMVYEEAAGRVVYTGDVVIRQGDIETRSPQATLLMSADGNTLKSVVAGEPVDVVQAGSHASGRKGTYDPSKETMTLEGENVVLKNIGREVRGRSLVFHVGDERVLVDGAEEERTQTIFRPESPRP